jgi:hypothetical protein
MSNSLHRLAAAAGLGVLMAGCGGGGHATSLAPRAAATSTGAPNATAHFTLTIPNASATSASGRKPAFVSSATLSGTIQVNGGATTQLDLSAASPNCEAVSGGRACVISVPAPAGSDTFTIVLYSGPFTGGLHTGTALSAASNFAATVVEGAGNVTTPLILGGIPATADVTAAPPVSGQAGTEPLVVTAYDSSANIIVGQGSYADASGAAAPLTVALAITPYNNQVTLHNGPQSGTSITVAGATDAPTLQLSAPANVIGIPFTVTTSALVALPAHTSQIIAVSGTLTATLLATVVVGQPDYTLYAPMNLSSATGMVNGFVFDFGSQSNGGQIGFFNSNAVPENLNYCIVPGALADAAVSPIDGGVAFAYSAGLFVDTSPWGLNWLPRADFTSGACPAGTPFETDTLGTPGSVVRSMAYDPVAHKLFTGGDNSTTALGLGVTVNPSLRYESFSGAAFSADTILVNNLAHPVLSMIDTNNRRFYIIGSGGSVVNTQSGISAPTTATIPGASVTTIVSGYDGRAYALDDGNKTVYAWNGVSAPVRYTAGAFVNAPPAFQWQLAMGPDGTAFASAGTRTVESLPVSGSSTSVAIPTASGNGNVDALFDGTNGYVYAVIDDGLDNGTMNVVRISR